jgi:Domain of unknown function (DUF1942)
VRKLGMIAAVATALLMVGVAIPATASAANECPHRFGAPQRLEDAGGAVVQEWTVTDLRQSSDSAPGYPLAGRLWEATASVQAVSGSVTPIIPNIRAVSASRTNYPVMWQLSSPAGISGATLAQGQTSTGKVYFDVTGDDPMAVVYTTGGPKPAMMWCCDGDMMRPMDDMMGMDMPMSMDMGDCPHCANMQP